MMLPSCLSLAAVVAYPARDVLNTGIWAAALALQCVLACVVFARGLARRFPAFAALLVFYPLRSAVLFVLSRHLEAHIYDGISNSLAILEFLLLLLVAAGLLRWRVQRAGGWTLRRALFTLLALGAAAGLTWTVLQALPPRMPADRTQIFAGFVLLALAGAMIRSAWRVNATRIAAGFAAFSLLQFVALAGRAHAAVLRDAGSYIAWSYLPAAGYLAVVVYWMAVLRREPSGIAEG